MASHHRNRPVSPRLPTTRPRGLVAGMQGLVRLAVESWQDGCLAEGAAAACAARGADGARDEQARQVQSVIARDEAGHTALAWRVLAWAIAQGGNEVRRALQVCPRESRRLVGLDDRQSRGLVRRHGRLLQSEVDDVTADNTRRSRRQLHEML